MGNNKKLPPPKAQLQQADLMQQFDAIVQQVTAQQLRVTVGEAVVDAADNEAADALHPTEANNGEQLTMMNDLAPRERSIAIAIQANVPILIWGPPGAGKTAFTNQISRALGRHCETVIASIREPSDFAGLPFRDQGEVKLAPPSWAKRISSYGKFNKPSVLFLDEITTTAPATQAALLRVILDRVVGDLALPDSCSIVSAANPPEIAAGGWELALPLLNRFFHIEWELNASRWCEGITKGFEVRNIPMLPAGWHESIPEWRGRVADYIRRQTRSLLMVPDRADANTRAYPTPRSWEMAARLCAAARAVDPNADLLLYLTGTVGTGAGVEFNSHVSKNVLTDPNELLKNPTAYQHIAARDKRDALISSVVNIASKDGTEPVIRNAITVIFLAVTQSKSPGEFAGHVKRLAASSVHNILSLIEDPQMRDYFAAHFGLQS